MSISRLVLAVPFALLAACSSTKGSDIVTERMHAEPEDAGAADAGECGGETTQTACVTCCSNKHEDAFDACVGQSSCTAKGT